MPVGTPPYLDSMGQPSASHWAPDVIAAVQNPPVAPASFDASVLEATAEV